MNKEKRRNLSDRLRSIFLYCGLSKPGYQAVKSRIIDENERNMLGVSGIGFLSGLLLTVFAMAGILKRRPLPAYAFFFICSAAFMILRRAARKRKKRLGLKWAYLQTFGLLVFGILNSAVFSPTKNYVGVTFCVMLVIPAFILIDRPVREVPMLLVSSTGYLTAVHLCKDPQTFEMETANVLAFTAAGILCILMNTPRFVRSLSDRIYIEKERDLDSLTKTQTRQAAVAMIHSCLDRGAGGAFFMIDIDNFKGINDTFGHLRGDEVLRRFARCVERNVRRSDIVGRFGGDEFIVYLPFLGVDEAAFVAGRILESVRDEFRQEKISISCSIGISIVRPYESFDAFFSRADAAVYEAKRNGKGRYAVA